MRLFSLHFEKLIKKNQCLWEGEHDNCNQGKTGTAPVLQGSSLPARQPSPKSQGPASTQIALNQPQRVQHPEESAEGVIWKPYFRVFFW